MILLEGKSLTPRTYFTPEAMSLSIEERNSSASMTLGPDAPEISISDWLQDDTEPGKGIVWRVRSVSENEETKTRTVTLEHIVQTLKDNVLFGEVTAAMMGGGEECTAKQAAQYVVRNESAWKIGDVAENPSNPYAFNGDTLYAALEEITSSIEDAQWEYDLTKLPFTLHIRKPPAGAQSEMRMSRNITTMRRQIDRSRMYTRIYPIGKNNLHISGNYLSRNEEIWGTVCKVETDQSRESESSLRSWAKARLARHCNPLVTITIGGLDLSRDTGEELDHQSVGRRCQVPLPDKGIVIREKITKLNWPDKIKEPKKFTVTLANNREDVASIVNNLQKTVSGGGGGRAAAKNAEEDHAWFEDTTDHVAMVAEAVAGEGASKDWSRVAKVLVDGDGVHQRVTKTEKGLATAENSIDVLEDTISLKMVKKGEIVSEINMEPGNIRIKAAKINIDGVIQNIKAVQGSITDLSSGRTNITKLWVNNIQGYSATLTGTLTYLGHTIISMNAYNRNGDNIAVLGWRQ